MYGLNIITLEQQDKEPKFIDYKSVNEPKTSWRFRNTLLSLEKCVTFKQRVDALKAYYWERWKRMLIAILIFKSDMLINKFNEIVAKEFKIKKLLGMIRI